MPLLTQLPATRIPMAIVLAVMGLQALLYYPRLPAEIACKWDLSRDPSRWCGKGAFFLATWAGACAVAALSLASPVFLAWPLAGILLFIIVVNQYIIAANMGDGRLPASFFIAVGLLVLALLAAVLWGVRP